MFKPKYFCNDSFFAIPNPINSYWAGFIAADGSIDKRDSRLAIELGIKDEIILQTFKTQIEYTGIISYTKTKRDNIVQPRINIFSKKIVNDLNNNFNITPRKSLTLKPPNNLDKDCTEAFIKGYIDGDGCFYLAKDYHRGTGNFIPHLSILGTFEILSWIQNYINTLTNIGGAGSLARERSVWVLQYKRHKCLYIYKNLCPNPTFLLERKWRKFDNESSVDKFYKGK